MGIGPKIKQETKDHLKFLVAQCQISQEIINKWFSKAGIAQWEEFTEEQAILIIEKLETNNIDAKQAWIDFVKVRNLCCFRIYFNFQRIVWNF